MAKPHHKKHHHHGWIPCCAHRKHVHKHPEHHETQKKPDKYHHYLPTHMDLHNVPSWTDAQEQMLVQFRAQQARKAGHTGRASFESQNQKICHRVLNHPAFESFFGLLILGNLALVIIETDMVARDESLPAWAITCSWVILLSFVAELVLRIYVWRTIFWLDGINLFDFVLVTVDMCMNLVGLFAGHHIPVSFLRIIRLCKLARVSRAFHRFKELRLMMAGLVGSMKAIFWGAVLLAFAVLTSAIIAVQFLNPLNVEMAEKGVYDDLACVRCPRAYATVFDATLTISQQIVVGDAWSETSVPMIEHHPETAVYYAIVFMIVGLSVLNLILGVVVETASLAREHLAEEIRDESLLDTLEVHSHLRTLCRALDSNNNGMISKAELFEGYEKSEEFREALSNMGVTQEDLKVLWTILDGDKMGKVSYEKFVTCCYKLKSSTTNFMLAYIKYYIHGIKVVLSRELKKVDTDVMGNRTEVLKNRKPHRQDSHTDETDMDDEEDEVIHRKGWPPGYPPVLPTRTTSNLQLPSSNNSLADFEHQWNRLHDAIAHNHRGIATVQQETHQLLDKAHEGYMLIEGLVRGVHTMCQELRETIKQDASRDAGRAGGRELEGTPLVGYGKGSAPVAQGTKLGDGSVPVAQSTKLGAHPCTVALVGNGNGLLPEHSAPAPTSTAQEPNLGAHPSTVSLVGNGSGLVPAHSSPAPTAQKPHLGAAPAPSKVDLHECSVVDLIRRSTT